MIYRDIAKKIGKLRKKLDKSIEEKGISSEETLKISQELDEVIAAYFKESK